MYYTNRPFPESQFVPLSIAAGCAGYEFFFLLLGIGSPDGSCPVPTSGEVLFLGGVPVWVLRYTDEHSERKHQIRIHARLIPLAQRGLC